MGSDEFLVGIVVSVGENHGSHEDPVFVEFLPTTGGDSHTVKSKAESIEDAVDVKRVRDRVNLTDFFRLFKRFEISISPRGMLSGKKYRFND